MFITKHGKDSDIVFVYAYIQDYILHLFKSIIDILTLLLYYLFDFILLEKPKDLSG